MLTAPSAEGRWTEEHIWSICVGRWHGTFPFELESRHADRWVPLNLTVASKAKHRTNDQEHETPAEAGHLLLIAVPDRRAVFPQNGGIRGG